MKTWWHYFPIILFAASIPFLIGALPTVEFNGQYWGGGPIRQFAINALAALLPDITSDHLINSFMKANSREEYLLYTPVAINLSLIFAWLAYGAGQLIISINNWFFKQKYQSQRLAAKQ